MQNGGGADDAAAAGRSAPGKATFTVLSQVDNRRFRIVVKEADLARLRVDRIKAQLSKTCGIPVAEQVSDATAEPGAAHSTAGTAI